MTIPIPAFSRARVLVVGDVMLDRYWHGSCSRVSPEAPVPVVKVEANVERPGGAANVAVNIASLGGMARVLGVTGADEAAVMLERNLASLGVASDLIKLATRTTIVKLRVLSRHQQLLRLDFEDGFPDFDGAGLLALYHQRLADHDIVILSDYGKGALRHIEPYMEAARAAGRPVLVDPKGQDFSRYRGATLITPNLAEFQAVVGHCRNTADIEAKALPLLDELRLDAVLVTRSEHGMSLLRRDQPALHLPAEAKEVFDVTGAGDTVIAVLAAALAADARIEDAVALANIGAGIVVGKLGTASVTASELHAALYRHPQPAILDQAALLQAVAAARARGEAIVMTNGCFDILHAGHVHYLEQAKKLGDRLIVAVNDDASVRRLKGMKRPVNALESRMRVLAGLAAVDWVTPFYENTPERLICQVKPDFLVKGGDNDPAHIPGNQCVWEAGGQVVVMDYVEGLSTTRIVSKILGQSS